MPAQLQASNFHAAPVAPPHPVATQQQQQQPQAQHHHEMQSTPIAAKLKLLNTPNQGNGGSVLGAKSNDQHIDQAREILRQAVVAVSEAGGTKPASAVKKGTVRYRECQKNHAASIGGHAIDGCGEFMPGGEEGSVDALRCAACDCHRNFHRREVEGEVLCDCKRKPNPGAIGKLPMLFTPHGAGAPTTSTPMTTLALPSSGVGQMTPLTMAALSAGGPTDSDEQDDVGPGNSGGGGGVMMSMRSPSTIKKRFRTKFTTEQKDQMCAFAEKVGWRIQKHDEAAVQEFCANVGVKRHVLKVWMHNNKHTMGKKPWPSLSTPSPAAPLPYVVTLIQQAHTLNLSVTWWIHSFPPTADPLVDIPHNLRCTNSVLINVQNPVPASISISDQRYAHHVLITHSHLQVQVPTSCRHSGVTLINSGAL